MVPPIHPAHFDCDLLYLALERDRPDARIHVSSRSQMIDRIVRVRVIPFREIPMIKVKFTEPLNGVPCERVGLRRLSADLGSL